MCGCRSVCWIACCCRGYTVHEVPPPTAGIAALMALNIVEAKGPLPGAHGSAEQLHLQVEAMRLAFADALAYNADRRVVQVGAARQSCALAGAAPALRSRRPLAPPHPRRAGAGGRAAQQGARGAAGGAAGRPAVRAGRPRRGARLPRPPAARRRHRLLLRGGRPGQRLQLHQLQLLGLWQRHRARGGRRRWQAGVVCALGLAPPPARRLPAPTPYSAPPLTTRCLVAPAPARAAASRCRAGATTLCWTPATQTAWPLGSGRTTPSSPGWSRMLRATC
jgi:hypothetical protein